MHTLATKHLIQIYLKINLKEKDFAFCPEVTAKISKKN